MPPDGHEVNAGDVPAQVFESFLDDLAATDLDVEIRERLRAVLLGEKPVTEAALEAALFGDSP